MHLTSSPSFLIRTTFIPLVTCSLMLSGSPAAPGASPPKPSAPPTEASYHGYTLTQLDTMLQDPDPKQRITALVSLRDAGHAALPIFTWALNDEDPTVRIEAIKSIGPLGAASESAAPLLSNLLLADPIPAVRTQLIYTLGQMGPYAAAAIPALRHLQRTADITTRINAAQTLDRIQNAQHP
jgi:HEAT repeat protein